jgi:RNA polymerase sigma-70 factor (ECF subfamily)
LNDERLIAEVANGDHTALRELFERHAPWLGVRLRRTLPPYAVEDVVQETYIAVWRSASRYSGEGAVGAWIWGIARRQAAMWARANNRPLPMLETPATADPESEAVRAVDLAAAMAALGPGGDEQRELVRMVYLEDRSLNEVAEHLGIPQGTVKSRLFKARRLLRTALSGGKDD